MLQFYTNRMLDMFYKKGKLLLWKINSRFKLCFAKNPCLQLVNEQILIHMLIESFTQYYIQQLIYNTLNVSYFIKDLWSRSFKGLKLFLELTRIVILTLFAFIKILPLEKVSFFRKQTKWKRGKGEEREAEVKTM